LRALRLAREAEELANPPAPKVKAKPKAKTPAKTAAAKTPAKAAKKKADLT
jgi:hypothetical protein